MATAAGRESAAPRGAGVNFDRLAKPYRWLEYLSFGPGLQRTRICFLAELVSCRRALVLGDGDGRFTRALLRANREVRVHAVDVSSAMLAELRRSAGIYAQRVTTEVADLRCWHPAARESYDLVATHFFLDCLTTEEATALCQRVTAQAGPGALWVVSDFAEPATGFGRLVATPLVRLLYRAFYLLTGLGLDRLPDHAEALRNSGWEIVERRPRLKGLLFAELWRRNSNCQLSWVGLSRYLRLRSSSRTFV